MASSAFHNAIPTTYRKDWLSFYKFCSFSCRRYKGTREITSSARHHVFAEGDTYTLIINNVYGADADEYVCRASNKGGSKSTRAELKIMSKKIVGTRYRAKWCAKTHRRLCVRVLAAPPKFNVPPRFRDTAFFDKGENAMLKIPFTGYPKPKITWYRGNEHIESGGHYHVETTVSSPLFRAHRLRKRPTCVKTC